MILRPKACPAHTAACQKKSYLVAGDLVLLGKTQGDFTCVDYQSLLATKQVWTIGWLPSAALTPVAPMLAPKTSDWVGTWYHPGGSIEIKSGKRDILDVEGGMRADRKRFSQWRVQGAGYTQERHCGVCRRREGCRVRLQRIGPWLLAVDNSGCGGAGVTFTGLYRRKK